MPGEMFGAPAGIMAGQDMAAQNQSMALMGKKTQGVELDNQQKALQLQQTKAMLEMLNKAGFKTPGGGGDGTAGSNMADIADTMADIAVRSGNLAAAEKFIGKGADIRQKEATANKNQIEAEIKDLTLANGLLTDVHDDASLQSANMMYTSMTGRKSPLTGMRYSPELMARVRDMTTKELDRTRIKLDEQQLNASKAVESANKARLPLIKAQTNLADARAKSLGKAGGKTTQQIASNTKLATDMITHDFMGITGEEARIRGRQIAERAADLQAQNPSLKSSEAVQQAYVDMKKTGAFAPFTGRPMHTGTLERPASFPEDASKAVDKRYYIGPAGSKVAGQLLRWSAKDKKFYPVKQADKDQAYFDQAYSSGPPPEDDESTDEPAPEENEQ